MWKYIMMVVFVTLISGCTSIPPEAAGLSSELGKRISALENANLTLLNRYFDQKRVEVDRFIQDVWLPEFANELFHKTFIIKTWDTIISENNKPQGFKFLMKTAPKLQIAVNQKRLELKLPLDQLERYLEHNIKSEYDQARSINNSITSFLLSSIDLHKSRDSYLELLDVDDDRLSTIIDQIDSAVSSLMATDDKVISSDKFINKIKMIERTIK